MKYTEYKVVREDLHAIKQVLKDSFGETLKQDIWYSPEFGEPEIEPEEKEWELVADILI